jgi:hypothetical protein
MATKTFNGIGTSLTDGMNWTPAGVPGPADTAIMSTGFGILGGSNLNGAPLSFGVGFPSPTPPEPAPKLTLWDATLDMKTLGYGGGTVTAANNSTLNILNASTSLGTRLTVDISDWNKLHGTFAGVTKASVSINGHASVYDHSGSTGIGLGGSVALNTNVLGTGEWNMGFLGGLSINGQFNETVNFRGGGAVDVKTPTLFTGQINMSGNELENPGQLPQVSLEGLVATAATYDGSTLSLLYGSTIIDQVKISDPAPFSVYQAPTGVQIYAHEPSTPPPYQLLLHT